MYLRTHGFLLLLFIGCDSSPDLQQVLESSRKTTAEAEKLLESTRRTTAEAMNEFDESLKTPPLVSQSRLHPAEVLAEQLVSAFSRDELPEQRPKITVLNELDEEQREEVLQEIQNYVQSGQWSLWFTEIVVLQGNEEVDTCYFRSSQQDHIVVRMASDQKLWIVAACEIPEIRFARREEQTLEQHVAENVSSVKQQGTAYREGPLADGLYFIEH